MASSTKPKERPILFRGDLVRAILEGRPRKGGNARRKIDVPSDLIREAYEGGYTIAEIADALGVSVQPVKRIMREAGIARRAAARRKGRFCGEANPAWRGGRRVRPDGYVEVRRDGCAVLEHRAVVENQIGRALRSDEVVHHKDHNRQNNAPENLEVMSPAEHLRIHFPEMDARRWGR